jgi:hypothetical protein
MKNIILKLTLIAIIPFAITEAAAQCSPRLRADIPFDFVLNNKLVKAGTYSLEKTDCSTAVPLVVLRDSEGSSLGIVNRSATEIDSPKAHEQGSLIFARYGDSYFLSEVRDPLGRYSFRLRLGSDETQLAGSSNRSSFTVQLDNRTKKKLETKN